MEPEAIALLTYNGPEEVLLKTSVTLHGTYDPSRVTQIVVNAENKYRFTVILDAQAGIWKTELSEGFYQAGARWVRVQALDAGDRIIASQIINLIVSANPLSIGQDIKLTIQRDTLFKENPTDSGSAHLNTQVSAGTSFVVKRYSYVDGHILVELDQALETVGTTGYFYASHVELRKGQQILAFETGQIPVIIPGTCQLLITQETLLKQKPADSSDLSGNQSYLLRQGEQFEITGYACIRGHFRVTLHQEIPGFGQTGYLYFDHVQLTRNTEIVKFDANALLLTILDPTVFKKRPVNSSNLSESEKATLSGGHVYGVLHYEPADDGHIAITLSEHIPNFGNTGYLNASHIQLNRGAQVVQALTSQVEINVPYFSQRDNKFSPHTSCNVTALAMVMSYYGVQPKQGQLEDELYEWCLNNYGEGSQEENVVLVRLAQAYGFNSTFATDRTWAQIRDRLKQKQPVVIGGYFTAQGHLLTLIGYSEQGYLVNDPWGDALTGYRSAYGRNLSYPKAYMEKMCSPEGDGSIWAHFIEPKA
ncbi:MAG: C39 family peptidase [Synechococcales cyanobacterium CRU_2_2]|nr:C39 family peptidase [Synechococcales cyanobacterium CRU_2_2]